MSLKFSQALKRLLPKLAPLSLTLAEILQETAEPGFMLMIGLLVLPFLFPMPPGLSGVMGMGCFCLAIQMALGRKSPWLPQKVAQFKFPRSLSLKLLKNIGHLAVGLEKIVRPRWQKVASNS